jgi:formylglycine-generating enzyme required for sulfatase activity
MSVRAWVVVLGLAGALLSAAPVGAQSLQPDRVLTPAEEAALKPGDEFQECEVCPRMLAVPAGKFFMGSPPTERIRSEVEGPVREVTLARPFAIGKFELTFAQWDACVAAGGCRKYRPDDKGWGRGRRPAIYVSPSDAREYVAWLARRTGKGYRLPSEAEWEYAARAGTTTPFSFGAGITQKQANFDRPGGPTEEVGTFPANPWGLHDVHGNVWEIVEDCFLNHLRDHPADGAPVKACNHSLGVARGGSYLRQWFDVRSATRTAIPINERDAYFGVRVMRTLAP